jgi:hypothetical protein
VETSTPKIGVAAATHFFRNGHIHYLEDLLDYDCDLPTDLTDVRLERILMHSLAFWPPFRFAKDRTLRLSVVGYNQAFSFKSPLDCTRYMLMEDDMVIDESPDPSSQVIHSSRGPNISVTGTLALVRVSTGCRYLNRIYISKWPFAGP